MASVEIVVSLSSHPPIVSFKDSIDILVRPSDGLHTSKSCTMSNKSTIRKKIKEKRNLLSKKEVHDKSLKIANNIINNFFSNIKNLQDKKIALYLSANNEVDTKPILDYLLAIKNNNIALPRINPKNNLIEFKKYIPNQQLVNNEKYQNILEPNAKNPNIEPKIIFTPLVACDKNGNRIGMGGGFYDRKIAQIRKNSQNITIIGLAYDFQITAKIKPGEFDQYLDFIGLEDVLIKC